MFLLLYQILETRKVTKEQREVEWDNLQEKANSGEKRPFCRIVDSAGRMWAGKLKEISKKKKSSLKIGNNDWFLFVLLGFILICRISCFSQILAILLIQGRFRRKIGDLESTRSQDWFSLWKGVEESLQD